MAGDTTLSFNGKNNPADETEISDIESAGGDSNSTFSDDTQDADSPPPKNPTAKYATASHIFKPVHSGKPVTASRHGDSRALYSKLMALTPQFLKMQLNSIDSKINEYKRSRNISDEKLQKAVEIIQAHMVNRPVVLETVIHDLKENVSPDLFKTLLNPATKSQFGRGLPKHLLEAMQAIATFDDVSVAQRFDIKNDYLLQEWLYVLDQALFYRNIEYKNTADSFSMSTTDADGKVVELVSGKLERTQGEDEPDVMRFTLKENSPQAVHALADMIAMLSQGNNNGIKITAVGEPIETLTFMADIILDKKMNLQISQKLLDELRSDIAKLDPNKYDKDKLDQLLDFLVANSDTFDYQRRGVSAWAKGRDVKNMERNVSDLLTALAPRPGATAGRTADADDAELGATGNQTQQTRDPTQSFDDESYPSYLDNPGGLSPGEVNPDGVRISTHNP